MKLQTQFTVPKKDLRDIDYVKEIQTFEKTLKQSCKYYPFEQNYLIFWE